MILETVIRISLFHMIEKLRITITNKNKGKEEIGEEGSKERKKGGMEEGRKRVKASFSCKNRSEQLRASKVTTSCHQKPRLLSFALRSYQVASVTKVAS